MLYLHKTVCSASHDFSDEPIIRHVNFTVEKNSIIRVDSLFGLPITVNLWDGDNLIASKVFNDSSGAENPAIIAAVNPGEYRATVGPVFIGAPAGTVNVYDGIKIEHVNAGNYNPKQIQQTVEHQLADGGTFVVDFATVSKYENTLKVEFADEETTAFLKALYDARAAFRFVSEVHPEGDWLVLWIGEWDFKPTTNVIGNGYTGTITLKEASS